MKNTLQKIKANLNVIGKTIPTDATRVFAQRSYSQSEIQELANLIYPENAPPQLLVFKEGGIQQALGYLDRVLALRGAQDEQGAAEAKGGGPDLEQGHYLQRILAHNKTLIQLQNCVISKDRENYESDSFASRSEFFNLQRLTEDVGYWFRLCRRTGTGSFCIRRVASDVNSMTKILPDIKEMKDFVEMIRLMRVYKSRLKVMSKALNASSGEDSSVASSAVHVSFFDLEKRIMNYYRKIKTLIPEERKQEMELFHDKVTLYRDLMRIFRRQLKVCTILEAYLEAYLSSEGRSPHFSEKEIAFFKSNRELFPCWDMEKVLYEGLGDNDENTALFVFWLTEELVDLLRTHSDGLAKSKETGRNLQLQASSGVTAFHQATRGKKSVQAQILRSSQSIEYSALVWSNSFETGVHTIDKQNQRLLKLTNDLYLSCGINAAVAQAQYEKFLQQLLLHCRYGFAYEESLLLRLQHPSYNEHVKNHRSFMRRILEEHQHQAEKKANNNQDYRRLLSFLRDWLFSHVGSDDQDIARMVQNWRKHGAGSKEYKQVERYLEA